MMKNCIGYIRTLFAILAIAFYTPGRAADTKHTNDTYAILSLAGDSISTVVFNPTTGTHMDANQKRLLELHSAVLDAAAIEAGNEAIKRALPGVKTVLLVTPDPGLYQAQNAMFESIEANKENREFLKSLLTSRAVQYLVLITKFNAPTEIHLSNLHAGNGSINGLGFYMDNQMRTRNDETLEAGKGFLASFAYLKVRLIDARTLEVVGEVIEKQSSVFGNNNRGETGFLAWNLLSSKEKIDLLQNLVGVTMNDAIPRLLKK